jgi:hypothetical protein
MPWLRALPRDLRVPVGGRAFQWSVASGSSSSRERVGGGVQVVVVVIVKMAHGVHFGNGLL